jgi:SAM-dependent methyltransferase
MGHQKIADVTRIDLGCGKYKREGFFGIDIVNESGVDLLLNIEEKKLPFADNQIDHVFTSHMFEHIKNYPFVLQEIFRVCKPNALVEIWTPYGKANDAFLFEHDMFFTETHYKYICYLQDRYFLDKRHGYFLWQKTQYTLYPDIIKQLEELRIPLGFAMEHLFNIALEFGVFLQVKKDKAHAQGPQYPGRVYGYSRTDIVKTGEPDDITPVPKKVKTKRWHKKANR